MGVMFSARLQFVVCAVVAVVSYLLGAIVMITYSTWSVYGTDRARDRP